MKKRAQGLVEMKITLSDKSFYLIDVSVQRTVDIAEEWMNWEEGKGLHCLEIKHLAEEGLWIRTKDILSIEWKEKK